MNNKHSSIKNRASILFIDDGEVLLARARFNPKNKSNIGVILILLLSLSMLILFLFKGDDWFAIGVGGLLSGSLFVFSILSLLKEFTDFVKVNSHQIQFRNSLRSHTLSLKSNMKIVVASNIEYTKMKSQAGSGSYFRIIEIYLKFDQEEYRVFDFLVPEEYAKEANALGNEIADGIRSRVKAIR